MITALTMNISGKVFVDTALVKNVTGKVPVLQHLLKKNHTGKGKASLVTKEESTYK